ncbi:hypothetical protein [Stenotrophomonas sp. S41]|uniref:hypothetical protein n=1 Tax=Stenotrophomonas sp. S41 TaxID=2767464 RepID=UPI00190D86DA|nr:hypothetical protein [Stenotrophomonas sp. S41]MBK0012063.1 hypothetical protein [Stenotrophomonas sp. S41]
MADRKFWSSRASSTLLGVALLLPSMLVEAGPAPAQVQTFEVLQPRQFEILRSHAQAFVSAKEYAGFALDADETSGAWFHIRYQGRAVMAVENTPAGLVVGLPAGVDLLAPDVLRLRDEFRIWLEHGER